MSTHPTDKSPFIAAALIMAGVAAGLYILPSLIRTIAEFNQYLAYAVGGLFILSFFLIFWLRARYQKRQNEKSQER